MDGLPNHLWAHSADDIDFEAYLQRYYAQYDALKFGG